MASPSPEIYLLGLCDGELNPKRHRSSHLTNKLGGRPDWPPLISRQPPRCGRCGGPSAHVAQVYCPLEASPYHRNLHLFACPGADCGSRPEGWRALRSQCLDTEAPGRPAPAQGAPLTAADWCDAADDWGVDGEEEEDGGGGDGVWGGSVRTHGEGPEEGGAAALGGRLRDLSLGDPCDDVPAFRPFFISVVEESDLCGEDGELEHAQELLREYERREGVAVGELDGGGGGGQEEYEKSVARCGDAVFSRFMKRISPCPQQVLRYCRGGKPLYVSEPPPDTARAVPACGACGGSRTFELQLMPALVSLLRWEGGGGEAELEFGTVLVYTCAASCWAAGSGSPMEEFCFVQADPDQRLFN